MNTKILNSTLIMLILAFYEMYQLNCNDRKTKLRIISS